MLRWRTIRLVIANTVGLGAGRGKPLAYAIPPFPVAPPQRCVSGTNTLPNTGLVKSVARHSIMMTSQARPPMR
jgi:hypothetical protein